MKFQKILMLLLSMIITTNSSLALTSNEFTKLKDKLQAVCDIYNRPCEVKTLKSSNVNAFTSIQGEIYYTTGIINKLNYNEAYAVGLHEVGHHVLRHYNLGDMLQKKRVDFKAAHYRLETEADLFATKYALDNNEKNYLPEALTVIIPDTKKDLSTRTHPSRTIRIKHINNYTKYYKYLYFNNRMKHEKNYYTSYRR